MTFYSLYLKLCDDIGKSPSGAALELGITKPTVNKWKNGGGVTDATLLKVANYFGKTVAELKELQNEKPSTSEDVELSREDAELVDLILKASPEKKDAIRMLLR